MAYTREFLDYYALWQLEAHSPDWPPYKSPEAALIVKEQAESYGGLISISHFVRAFSELKSSGELVQLRQPQPQIEPEEFVLTPELYNQIPVADLKRRYRSDHEFKTQVDALQSAGLV